MGLFDKISKAVKIAEDFLDDGKLNNSNGSISNAVSKPVQTAAKKQTSYKVNTNTKSTPLDIMNSGNTPAKSSVLYESMFYDNDSSGNEIEVNYSFNISGDFVESDCGAAEIDTYFEYSLTSEPQDYDPMSPYAVPDIIVCNAAQESIYNAIDAYKKNKTVPETLAFEPVDNGKIYYKAKIDYFDRVMYMYGMDRGNNWKNSYIGVTYAKDAIGTPLEAKLIRALDEVVSTYKEEIV